jgi:putative transposase
VFIYAINKGKEKFNFNLYALCIMSNHVHYVLEPLLPEDLPKIMQWLNWYTAMCFNRMLKRTGHFWEQRYHSSAFEMTDNRRALYALRYVHANPKAAGMQDGFFYDFSNYGTHDRLTDDGLTKWHPAFLSLGKSLEECATRYRGFCKKYKPKAKPEKSYHWGSKLLPKVVKRTAKMKNKTSPGQMRLPWDDWEVADSEVRQVAEKFVMANCYDPRIAAQLFK